jgi:transposase
LDETSFGRCFQDSRGYAPIGKPLFIKRSRPRMTTLSFVVAVNDKKIVHRMGTTGSFNTEKFVSFLKEAPIPKGAVLLLDNVSFHHSKSVKELAEVKGWKLLFVPPYSPWYNPIEGIFSIVKREYYKHGCIDQAFNSVKQSHFKAFFEKSLSIKLI